MRLQEPYQTILEKLLTAKAELTELLSAGAVVDFPAYRYVVGRIQGLNDAETLLVELDRMERVANGEVGPDQD